MNRSENWAQWLVSVSLALLFWLSVALVKEYHFSVSLPVKYENYPERLKLLNSLPENIQVAVKGKGISLLLPSLGINVDTLKINLSQVIKKGHIKTAEILSNEKIYNTLSFTSIQPDSIFLFFEEKIEKKVVVVPELKMNVKDGFHYYKPFKLTPDSVILVGTQSDLKLISDWHTDEFNISDVYNSGSAMLKMEKSTDLMVIPEEIKLDYFINKYVEVSEMRQIEVVNTPPKSIVKIEPEKVLVRMLIPAEKYDDYKAHTMRVFIDYRNLMPNAHAVVPNISYDQNEIFSAQTEPRWVKFTIRKYNP